jgi:sodium/proline symporter
MVTGAITVVVWKQFSWFGLYEIIPGFILACVAIVLASRVGAPASPAMQERFEAVRTELEPGY